MEQGGLKEELSLLPDEPGIYRFLDREGVIIYIGKAKNLRKRVSSYFFGMSCKDAKVRLMVRKIARIEHTVVANEEEALLLENNMIKSFHPRYNIMMRDDKTYPFLAVTGEEFPRVIMTRRREGRGSRYFGPYASGMVQKTLRELVDKLYSLRTCYLPLTEENIRRGRFSKCLEYHIGNCKAPCEGLQSREEYLEGVEAAVEILKGDIRAAERFLTGKMMGYAADLRFEEAQLVQRRLAMLQNHQKRSTVVNSIRGEIDVFSFVRDGETVYCNYMHLREGAVVNSVSYQLMLRLEESDAEVLSFAITNIMDRLDRRLTSDVIVPFKPDTGMEGVKFTVPQRGDKLQVLELSEKNSRVYRLEKLKQAEKRDPSKKTDRLMQIMKRELSLREEPRHIECFDNSNIQGAYPVSSCVVFRLGKPSKREYRHFNIKTVGGIDDFASMRETVKRRYTRMLEEGGSLPQLIVVDGGKGQLSAAYDVLVGLGLENRIEMIGLAKRLEEIFRPGDPDPLCLDKQGETLKVLMHIRDEAHRFGITFHRNKRSKGFINSELSEIPNLGPKSVEKLLKHFDSAAKVKKASEEELVPVVGPSRARAIVGYFKK